MFFYSKSQDTTPHEVNCIPQPIPLRKIHGVENSAYADGLRSVIISVCPLANADAADRQLYVAKGGSDGNTCLDANAP